MFKAVWKPVITAIAYAFITFEDDYIIQRAIAGFRQCATLAGRFNLPDVFDFVVVSLSQATGLLSDSLPSQIPNYPVVEVEGQSVTISRLSVEFGTNFKGQLAAVVLFNIVNGNGNALREGWTQVSYSSSFLVRFSLVPLDFRDVPKPFLALSTTDTHAPDARFLGRPYYDSSER
jgi:brefeldin A-resistance guanine nucleotide exchange factor 1